MSGFEPIAAQAVAAEVGTAALASEVVAANALAGANLAAYTPAIAGSLASIPAAAGLTAGLGALGSAVPGMYGVGTATGIPTLTQQLATASPEVLAQIQGALQPAMINNPALASGLSGAPLSGQFSSAELANITGNIPTAGPGIETAYANTGNLANSGVTPDMLQAPVPDTTLEAVGSRLSPIEENIALRDAAAKINPQTNLFGNTGSGFTDMIKRAYKDFKEMPTKDKLLYGGVASLAAPTIMGMFKDKKELGGTSPYDGPLSQYGFDPDRYRAQKLAQPDPYRARYAGGGTIEEMSNANAVGANTGYPMANIAPGAYATPYQQPISRNVISDALDTGVNPMTGEMSFAGGGLSGGKVPMRPTLFSNRSAKKAPPPTQFAVPVARAPIAPPVPYKARYAQGGISDLGGYSDGGRMLKGPGDGMSDNIPASIAGKQPARLANEEFVIPADVVSHLGNGSSEAGAKQLYKMMDRVRQARTGKKAQGKQIKADKYMPA